MLIPKIKETINICEIHKKRLEYAYSKVLPFLPINEEKYYSIDNNLISYIDQYIFRFSKLQDVIGQKLFKEILMLADEDVEKMTFRDILNRLEKLELINSRYAWLKLRELRNSVAHEYPTSDSESIEALNELFNVKNEIIEVLNKCSDFVAKHTDY